MKWNFNFEHFKAKVLCLFLIFCFAGGCGRDKTTSKRILAKSLKELAHSGDPAAQNQWGFDLINGHGVSKDPEKGVEWIHKSAKQGNPKAQFNLALMHQTGQWVEPDLGKAFQMMSSAARQGLPEAQTGVGFMYEKGQGIDPDMTEALYWYRRAATYGKVCETSKSHFQKNILSHRKEQFLYGDRDAQYLLGLIYEKGVEGVIADADEAVRWYEDAAVRGDVASQARLALLLGIKGNPRIDKTMGYAWAKLAAESASTENMKMPYQRLQSLLSPAEKAVAESVYRQLSEQVSYNLKDLDLSS